MIRDHLQTKGGIINLVIVVLNVVNFICIVSGTLTSAGIAFMIVAILGFLFTSTFIIIYFFHLNEKKLSWPWSRIEIFYTQSWIIFYMVVSGLILNIGNTHYIAAGIFGLFTSLAYMVKSLHIYVTQIVDEATSVYVRT